MRNLNLSLNPTRLNRWKIPPSRSMVSRHSKAWRSMSSVISSIAFDPPTGSTVLGTPTPTNNLLRSESKPRGIRSWKRQCLVPSSSYAVTEHRRNGRECLKSDAHDVVVMLLCRQRRSCRLRVETNIIERGLFAIGTSLLLCYQIRRKQGGTWRMSSRKSLWVLKKNDRRGAKPSKSIPRAMGSLSVGNCVRKREGQLLHCRGAIPDVIAADRYRAPIGKFNRRSTDG